MKKLDAVKAARNLKKLEKLGGVPMKDFETLKQDVQLQRIGFLALAGLEIIRIAKPKKGLKDKDVDRIAEAVMNKIIDTSDDSEEYYEEVSHTEPASKGTTVETPTKPEEPEPAYSVEES